MLTNHAAERDAASPPRAAPARTNISRSDTRRTRRERESIACDVTRNVIRSDSLPEEKNRQEERKKERKTASVILVSKPDCGLF